MINKFRRSILALALVLTLCVSAFASIMFNRNVSLTGGAAISVSTVMIANGYSGSYGLDELAFRNTGAGTIYFGNSEVNASVGIALAPGESYRWAAQGGSGAYKIDSSQIYLFTASTQNVGIISRSER